MLLRPLVVGVLIGLLLHKGHRCFCTRVSAAGLSKEAQSCEPDGHEHHWTRAEPAFAKVNTSSTSVCREERKAVAIDSSVCRA